MAGSTARRRCAPSSAVATPPTGFSSPMSRPPSPPGTGPAPFACRAPTQHGKPMTMTTTHSRPAVVSPRVPEPTLARYPAATRAPRPHTAAELDRLIRMLRASRAETIAIGHGRYTASAGAADALAAAWTAGAGQVLAVVDWPAAAASWLRPAQRLAGSQRDAWILPIPRPDAHSSPAVSPASPAGLPTGRWASPAWPLLTSWH
jgi:hypothetical protein